MSGRPNKPRMVDLGDVTRLPIADRTNKTRISDFGRPLAENPSVSDLLDSLPKYLKASDLRRFIAQVALAREKELPFHLFLGAHTIKVGLSPIIIDLLKHEIVTGLSFNGAGLIHDLELAFFGGTSEDVQSGLSEGTFGMVKETAVLFAEVAETAEREQIGLGQAGGLLINERKAPNRELSVFAVCHSLGCPVTVHVAIGTDIVCQHPEFDGAKAGAASHRDFRLLASICESIDRGGVAANIGSTVLLPEVFLKALTVARNITKQPSNLTTANFDMIEHYRPHMNVVSRPTLNVGRGYSFIGHHEIMIPLLACWLRQACAHK